MSNKKQTQQPKIVEAAPAEELKKLSIEDPVSPGDLARFGELQMARGQIAERLLELKQEEIRTLRAASNVDTERQRLFEKVLMERGLPPTAPVEIDAKTGTVKLVEGAAQRAPAPAKQESEAAE